MIKQRVTAAFLSLSLLTSAAFAADLKITDTDGEEHARYSQADLEALGTRQISTSTPWTEGVVTFTGVDATKVMTDAGFEGASLTAIAIDDYAIEIDWEDFEDNNALIATTLNGERLTSGNKGPFWIVFDYDNVKVGMEGDLRSKSVWHLIELEIE